jgi:hypothetical protein
MGFTSGSGRFCWKSRNSRAVENPATACSVIFGCPRKRTKSYLCRPRCIRLGPPRSVGHDRVDSARRIGETPPTFSTKSATSGHSIYLQFDMMNPSGRRDCEDQSAGCGPVAAKIVHSPETSCNGLLDWQRRCPISNQILDCVRDQHLAGAGHRGDAGTTDADPAQCARPRGRGRRAAPSGAAGQPRRGSLSWARERWHLLCCVSGRSLMELPARFGCRIFADHHSPGNCSRRKPHDWNMQRG